MNFLFWNTGKCKPIDEITSLVKDLRVDVLILAEYPSSPVEIIERLNMGSRAKYHLPFNPAKMFIIIVALPPKNCIPVYDGYGVSIWHIKPPINQDILLATLHLPSKRFYSEPEQTGIASRTIRVIEQAEHKVGHRRTLIIGDFNMNPFEDGLISSEGFHAVMTKSIAAREQRVVHGEVRRYFYNPMWSLLGDFSPGPPGSYYYSQSTPISCFWNMFDQALLRPDLSSSFMLGDVTIIDSVASKTLLTPTGIPNKLISDHLPVFAKIHLKEHENGTEEPLGRIIHIVSNNTDTNRDTKKTSGSVVGHDERNTTG